MQADEDTVRDVIHRFDEIGLACLDPQWAGGRPRLLSPDEDFVVRTASTRPSKLGQPFTCWPIRKLAAYLRRAHGRVIRIGREALRVCSPAAVSPSSGARRGRSRLTPSATPSWTASRRCGAHFGPLRQFTIANSHHPNHTAQTRALHTHLRRRNANTRHRSLNDPTNPRDHSTGEQGFTGQANPCS